MHVHSSPVIRQSDIAWYSMAIMAGAVAVLLANTVMDPGWDGNAQATHEIMLQIDVATAQLVEWQLRQL